MNIWLKSALSEDQLWSRCDESGACRPLEVYLGSAKDLMQETGLLRVERFLAQNPQCGFKRVSALLRIFHLPVSPHFTLEALAFRATERNLVLHYAKMLRSHGFEHVRILTHLQSQPEMIRSLGLEEQFLNGLKPFSEANIELFIEQTQMMTANASDIQVDTTWEDSIFRYHLWLQEALPQLRLRTVLDICHLMNSFHVLQKLDLSEGPMDVAVLNFLKKHRHFGPDHIHLSSGRSYRQGVQWHGCGFDTAEEKKCLTTWLDYLTDTNYKGGIVIETNEQHMLQPERMHRLKKQVQSIITQRDNRTGKQFNLKTNVVNTDMEMRT